MTVKEYTAAKLKELQQKEAKDKLANPGKFKEETGDEKELSKKFWGALASRNPQKMYEAEEAIKKDFEARGIDWSEKAQTVGTPGSGTSGGILVPTSVSDKIISKMVYISPIRQIATVISDMPAQLQLPSENTMAQAYWVGEGAAPTATGEVFDPNLLTPWKA